MNIRLLLCLLLVSLIVIQPSAAQPVVDHRPVAQILQASDFDQGDHQRTARTPNGLAPTAATGTFTSAIITAPREFNYLLPHWQATLPISTELELEIRVSLDQNTWTDWGHLHENDDLLDLRDPPGTAWGAITYAGVARYWQVRATLSSAPDDQRPTLHSVTISTVDSRDASARDLKPTQPRLMPVGINQPGYVSRATWGGSEVAQNSVPANYYRASHLVVHHTADANSLVGQENNWADRVMAVWRFHTYPSGRGWGDVGYNWLIDPNGVIYEGRRGSADPSQDSVGFHDTANYGSMGVVMLGTFSNVTPSNPAQNSLVNLLAWKADQRQIDPYGSSYYYGCARSSYCAPYHSGANVANLAGHREVLPGHTTCPGDQAINILPSVRQRVAAMLRPGDNGDTVIDDLETGFSSLGGDWYSTASGYNGRALYTFATNDWAESTNSARWTPNLPQTGQYKVEARLPQNTAVSGFPTESAYYVVTSAQGTATVKRSHTGNEQWLDLGTYQFNGGTGGHVFLNDMTDEPYSPSNARPIFFDAIRWTYVPPEQPDIELLDVQVSPTTLHAGEVVRISFTVRNPGNVPVASQDPQPGQPGDLTSGYVYDEAECFIGNSGQSYPAFPKVTGRFRLTLGGSGDGAPLGTDCNGSTSSNPWRWGFGNDLQPGETRTIVGAVRVQNFGTTSRQISLFAGLVNENIRYNVQNVSLGTITVQPERRPPQVSQLDGQGLPLAQVHTLKIMPQSLLARTVNPLSVVEDQFVGTFGWDGRATQWGAGGPLGQSDYFVVDQVRPFVAPVSGIYTFRLDTDDGAWLWIDGSLVVDNHGLHEDTPVTASRYLNAGLHALSFKYFEYYGLATAQYRWQTPGNSDWSTIPVVPVTPSPSGIMLDAEQKLTIAADDMGGSGIAQVSYWIDNGWEELLVPDNNQPAVVAVGGLNDGPHNLRYRTYDQTYNISTDQTLTFWVNTLPPETSLGAQLLPSGGIQLSWQASPDVMRFKVEVRDAADGNWHLWTSIARTNVIFYGTSGQTYEFRVQADDGIFVANSNITAPITVPQNAIFSRQYAPLLTR